MAVRPIFDVWREKIPGALVTTKPPLAHSRLCPTIFLATTRGKPNNPGHEEVALAKVFDDEVRRGVFCVQREYLGLETVSSPQIRI